jgi:hypothetical protein
MQASGESDPRLPTEGDADRLQDRDESVRFPGVWGHKLWEALGEDATRAAQIPADEVPCPELEANRACALREVRQVARIAAMH